MKIKFLGTGGVHGIPVWNCDCSVCKSSDPKDKRLRPCIMISNEDGNILVDFGQDLRAQLMKYGIKKLDLALLTHAHGDHTYGFQELAVQENLKFQTHPDVLEEFERRLGSSKGWLERRNPTIKIEGFTPKEMFGMSIESIHLEHKKDYSKIDVPCYGYVFRSGGSSFAYLTDFNRIIEEDKLGHVNVMVVDGNETDPGKGHLGIDGSIELYKRLKPDRMILTHINHKKSHKEIQEYVSKHGNIEVAFDGMEIEL